MKRSLSIGRPCYQTAQFATVEGSCDKHHSAISPHHASVLTKIPIAYRNARYCGRETDAALTTIS